MRGAFAGTFPQQPTNKAYRATPVGGEVERFLRALLWADKSQNTLDTYEIVLARLAYEFAHFDSIQQFTTEVLRDFLDEHWGESSPATRRNRLSSSVPSSPGKSTSGE